MQPNNLQQIEKIIMDLSSSNKKLRVPAEKQIEQFFKKVPSQISQALAQVAFTSSNKDARIMSVVILRRYLMIGEVELYKKLDNQTKEFLREFSLKSFEKEKEENVRRNVLSLISDIADIDIPLNQWQNIFTVLENFSRSNEATLRGDVLYLYGNIAKSITLSGTATNNLINLMIRGLGDQDPRVPVKAFEAVVAFSEKLNDNDDYGELMNKILALIRKEIKQSNTEVMTKLFEDMIDLATICPKIFRNHLEESAELFSNVAMFKDFPSDVRIFALEILISLAESDNGLYRSSDKFVKLCFMSAMAFMVEIEDNPNWINDLDDEEESEDEDIRQEGEFAIDRAAQSFGSLKTMTHAIPLVRNLLSSPDWKSRVTGLMSISQMAESIENSEVETILKIVGPHLSDEHPRVKFAAIHCIGQICEDFAPDIQKKFHQLILPALVSILKDCDVVKIQAHAGAALVNFVENVDSKVMAQYLAQLFDILYSLMSTRPRVVREQIVTVLASVAGSTPNEFFGHLEKIVPVLLRFHMQCVNKEDVLFKAKCLEALTFIGTQLGRPRFGTVAHELMKVSLMQVVEFREKSDEYFDFLLQSWIRLAKILGEEFAQYLPQVMALIFATLKEDEDHTENGVGASKSDVEDSEDEEYVPGNSDVNEIESALCALSIIPSSVGLHFAPYLPESVSIIEDYIGMWTDENSRNYAVSSFPGIFRVVVLASLNEKSEITPENAVLCLSNFTQKLMEAFIEEKDYAIKKSILSSIYSMLETNWNISTRYFVENNNGEIMFKALFNLIKLSRTKMQKIDTKLLNTEIDEEQVRRYQTVKELENIMLYQVAEIFGEVLKILRENATGTLGVFLADIIGVLNADNDMITKKAMLLLVLEILTFLPASLTQYEHLLTPLFIDLLKVNDDDKKTAAIHGLGLIAEGFPKNFLSKSESVLNICMQIWESLKGETEHGDKLKLRDNAVSTYGRIIQSCSPHIDIGKSFPVWISMLPLAKDVEEIQFTSRLLHKAIDSGDPKFLGENLSFIPRILNIIASDFEKIEMDDARKLILKNFLTKIKSLPADTQNGIASNLTESAKQMILNFESA